MVCLSVGACHEGDAMLKHPLIHTGFTIPGLLATGCLVLLLFSGCGTTTVTEQRPTSQVAATSAPTPTRHTQRPVYPTPPPYTPPSYPTPIILTSSGQDVTRAVPLPATIAVIELHHGGSRNFIVKAHFGGQEELLVNTIGYYHGFRPLAARSPVTFEVQADGTWSIEVTPLADGGRPAVSGEGDYVSATFTPPSAGAWEVRHSGTRNFIVKAHCAGGSELVQNKIGAVGGSVFVTFPRGPCFWEIEADGRWSLQPRG